MKKRNIKLKLPQLVLLLLIFQLSNISIIAQTIERQLIGTAGNINSSANMQISATAGEIAVNTETTGTIILTQGFQQAEPEDFVGILYTDLSSIEYHIYPNPTISGIDIKLKSERHNQLLICSYDLKGKKILPDVNVSFSGEIVKTINMNSLPANTYLINIIDKKGKKIKSFKVIKTH